MKNSNLNKKISPITWLFRIMLGIVMPSIVFPVLIYLPYLLEGQDKGSIYSIYWSIILILALLLPTVATRLLKKWIEKNEELIGWCITTLMSYTVPIGIILSVALLDSNHINMTMTYLSAGFVSYVGLRMQSNYLTTCWAWILPFSMVISSSIIGYSYGFSVVIFGLAVSLIVYLLGIKIHRRSDNNQHETTENVCLGLVDKVEHIVEKDKLKGVAFCILIRDFLYNWAKQQNETPHREAILQKIKHLSDCFNNPTNAIAEMTSFSPELIKLYHRYDDQYYNLALVEKIIKDECIDLSQKDSWI